MKIGLFICSSWLVSVQILAQTTKAPILNPTVRVQEKVYRSARENNDLEVATNALYQLIALQPENKNWEDSLCLVYFGRGYYVQSAKLANDVLKRNPNSLPFRELLAQAYEGMGSYSEALKQYELLLRANENQVFYYKIATLQYYLKQYDICEKSIRKILSDPDSQTKTISTQSDPSVNILKDVPMRAAALNILGVLYMEQNRTKEAVKSFEDALVYYPEFILVKQNLELIKKREQSTP
jgi:tetratricopeptide (TPR) repeat protein